MRRSRLVLALAVAFASLLGLGGALAARRVLSQPATHLAGSASLAASLAAASSASAPPPAEPDPHADARARLAEFEAERRRATDFAHLPPANQTHGADPYALVALDAAHSLGVLRGASAIVLLDARLHELQRIEVPGSAVAVTRAADGDYWIGGETTSLLTSVHFDGRRLRVTRTLKIAGALGFRSLAAGPEGLLYALESHDGRLITLDLAGHVGDARPIGHGPLSVRRVGKSLIVDALLDHALIVSDVDSAGLPVLNERARVHHDGPIWGFDVAPLPGGDLLIAASGVEDHPLDRSDGSFGYVDSFAFAYLLPAQGELQKLWQVNVSELGVVTPKAPLLRVDGAHARLFLSGYGSDRAVELYFGTRHSEPPTAQSEPFYPGTSAAIRLPSGDLAFADPLLDAWLFVPVHGAGVVQGHAPGELREVEAASAPRASREERLGEALFFTTLMAPSNSSEGKQSRFTCETCHFEGYVDGRVHYTGRADVYATTKPLRGLFNNRPHFSRALDADLTTVSHHEFRVAGKGNGSDPWFELQRADFPWLAELGVAKQRIGAEALRRALIAFLMRFSHTANPAVVGRSGYADNQLHGAELFRDHCANCHAPRLQSDVPESALSFDAWPAAIFSPEGPLVWASAEYRKTGVTPYVHELGARVPSLRRLSKKWPYFTNGSAKTLYDLVAAARFDEPRFFHAHAPADSKLSQFSSSETFDLVAFLELL